VSDAPDRRLSVLASAFACAPGYGSEVGMGWGWVSHLARHCSLTVISEEQFREPALAAVEKLPPEHRPEFHYLPINEAARRRFWRSGDWRFYRDYREWQQRALRLAAGLVREQRFDVVHQLNCIGYREPGYLWKLPGPFVWGPVGGFNSIPWAFLPTLGGRAAAYNAARNLLNLTQMYSSVRVRQAVRRASVVLAATEEDRAALARVYGAVPLLLNEQGTYEGATRAVPELPPRPGTLRLFWAGVFHGRKGLPLLLHALARVPAIAVELHVCGDGPEQDHWRRLARNLGVAERCTWYGRVPHDRALAIMASCDALALSSLLEGTPAVVLEAIERGVPVICHDACGFGSVVDASCAITFPLRSPQRSIEGFADAIRRLATEPGLVERLSAGARRRAGDITWDGKARQVVEIYRRVLPGPARTTPRERVAGA
jgi:glycosyltransferase involved in cell wall biosynthesis